MDISDLINLTAKELVRRIQASAALSVFAKRRAKFEGWLKVELIDVLIKNGVPDVVPEQGLIDVSFGNVAIELKTVNTNFRDAHAENRNKPITKNISSVIQDIAKHRNNKFLHKFIIFVVFPLSNGHKGWIAHLKKIEEQLGGQCSSHYFQFREADGVSGCIFYGEVVEKMNADQRAPDFKLEDGNGNEWKLSDHHGKIVVLLFYPGDNTPVCTAQLCSVRDHWSEYQATGAEVVGISTDSVESHKGFAEKNELPLRLLSDPDRAVTTAYDMKSWLPGRAARGVVVVDKEGKIAYHKAQALSLFRPADDDVLDAIRKVQ